MKASLNNVPRVSRSAFTLIELLVAARHSPLTVEAAREGLEVPLPKAQPA